ncbi:MAG: hypothetical protein ACRCWR_04100 [Saezia sp.]
MDEIIIVVPPGNGANWLHRALLTIGIQCTIDNEFAPPGLIHVTNNADSDGDNGFKPLFDTSRIKCFFSLNLNWWKIMQKKQALVAEPNEEIVQFMEACRSSYLSLPHEIPRIFPFEQSLAGQVVAFNRLSQLLINQTFRFDYVAWLLSVHVSFRPRYNA